MFRKTSNNDPSAESSGGLLRTRKLKGGWVVLALLAVFFLWGAFAPLSKGIVAPGTVVVDSKRKTIQHLEGGVIRAIHVRDGEAVGDGAVLLELDDTKVKAERDMIRARHLARLATLDRLKAALENRSYIAFSAAVLSAKVEPAVAELIRLQLGMHRVLRLEQEGKLSIARQRIGQLEEKLRGLMAYRKSTERQVHLLEQEIERLEGLKQKQLVESSVVSERLQQLSHQQGELGRTVANIAETQVAIGEAKLNVIQVEREWQQNLSKEITENQNALVELDSQLAAAQSVLDRAVLKAPIAGTILGLKATTIGGVLTPGQPVMDIVPKDDTLVLEARVRTLDVDSVRQGMQAHVKFSGFNVKTMPDLEATVDHVSADILADPNGGEPFYQMRVSVAGRELEKLSGREIVPGMPVEVYADAGSRTLLQYLFDPLSSSLRKSLREK